MGTPPNAPPNLPPLRDVIRDFGLGARKSLGQHFLLDSNLTGRIARAADPLCGVNVIEIGPGPGGLTRALLASDADAVWAVEKDRRCVAALQVLQDAYPGRLRILEADALETDLTALTPAPRAIVANLPYNISTVLLLQWLRQADQFTRMVLMFQKEVADRLTAAPGSKAYGRLSVVTQWRAQVRPLFNVSKEAFTPPPKVASTVVEVIPRAAPLAPAVMTDLEQVTQAAFGQRRKMLRSSLKGLGLDPAQVGINPEARAEDLTVAEFCALARLLAERNA
ncbi:16S rRNA (adenine(1518)-N(6)/adenine(1519)-N(6))-dimethyltransferase RsmA [Thalassospiraceae bacterium LMO-SO8]|nr:16S rRNA (adenine(1518)-N(6)/adenine(1519)-N(6))-dimethyltransferase RsmA [Alphaproteobacteria bacterium LMO-S08]WND76097.1 16S rRNA (adenine(1518)-N(6)/adenine(1519)-N(6))-dimethyltransferase RsmA [Thalassospiraceae bacterium LMO-SO8]